MRKKRAATVTPSQADAKEIERFGHYLRLVGEAERLGVPREEACAAIYPDVWPDTPSESGRTRK